MEQSKTRKPHFKSRKGCLPCKARHVKCDEQKPKCVNCDKYGTRCEYAPVKARPVKSNYASPSQPVSTPSSIGGTHAYRSQSAPPDQGEPVLNIPQLRLLHHFIANTSLGLGQDSEHRNASQSYLLKVAFDFPYLLHGIFALTALHLSRLNPLCENEYVSQAECYHNAGLKHFQAEVKDIGESNFEAVFCFAFVLYPYSCAAPLLLSNDNPEQAFDSIVQSLALTRSVRPMVAQFFYLVENSELEYLRPRDTMDIEWDNVTEDAELAKLRKFGEITRDLYPIDINEAYGEAIRALGRIFSLVNRSPSPPSPSLLKLWIHSITTRYMELLSARQPGALIIFAHYAVLLRRSDDHWFFKGFAEKILQMTEILVPSEWKSWLDWPTEQIRTSRVATIEHNGISFA